MNFASKSIEFELVFTEEKRNRFVIQRRWVYIPINELLINTYLLKFPQNVDNFKIVSSSYMNILVLL